MQSHEYRGGRRSGGSANHNPTLFHRAAGIDYAFRPETYPATAGADHPYLPSLDTDEVEIARLLLHTAQEEAISLRVRRSKVGALFRYRVVDEHGSIYVVRPATSRHPLTLGGLVVQIETTRHETGSPLGVALLEHQYRANRLPASVWEDFLEADSPVYLQLRNHYRAAVAMWLRAVEGGQR